MKILDKIHESWFPLMESLLYQKDINELFTNILPNCSYQPEKKDIFNVFETSLDDIKVVILGQEPYSIENYSNGYAFSTNQYKTPDLLSKIKTEVDKSIGFIPNGTTAYNNLLTWRESGVLLLNTALTVETGTTGSHLQYWDTFTRQIIQFISLKKPCIWLLWGIHAQSFAKNIKIPQQLVDGYDRQTIEQIPINNDYNYVMTAPHPLVDKYQGCDHFYFVNKILEQFKVSSIKW